MHDIIAEIEQQLEGFGGGWAAFLVRALWDHQAGLGRQRAIDAVLEDAINRGRPIPLSFEKTIQATFQQYNSGSNAFRGSAHNDIFEFVGGKGNGVWSLRRGRALAWMASNRRAGDFKIK